MEKKQVKQKGEITMETINDIVAEMRIGDLCAIDTSARTMYINDILASYADRIEAAAKREREATTEKSSAVGNAGTVRGIAQEMLNTSMQEITAEVVYGWASRLADACKQSVTDCNQLGSNTAKMREALEQADAVLSLISKSAWFIDANFSVNKAVIEAFNAIEAALDEPPRNCDVGTAEEQAERFKTFCYIYPLNCSGCPFKNIANTHNECAIFWLQMPYKEGGEK